MKNNKESKNSIYKKILSIGSVLAIFLIGGFYYYAPDLPFEAKMLLRHINEQKRTDDVINHPEKYQNLPCLEVQAGKDKYCFDRSRVSRVSVYNKPQSTEFSALKFQFISKWLPKPKKDKREYILGDIYVNNYDEYRVSNTSTIAEYRLKHLSKKSNKSYENFVTKNNNKILKIETPRMFDNETAYAFTQDNIPVAYIIVTEHEGVWKHSIKIHEYRKSKDELPILFHYWTNIENTKEEAIKKAINIAQEIYQFLHNSKVNQLQGE